MNTDRVASHTGILNEAHLGCSHLEKSFGANWWLARLIQMVHLRKAFGCSS